MIISIRVIKDEKENTEKTRFKSLNTNMDNLHVDGSFLLKKMKGNFKNNPTEVQNLGSMKMNYPICGVRPRPFSSAAVLATTTGGDLSGRIGITDDDVNSKRKRRARNSGFSSMTKL